MKQEQLKRLLLVEDEVLIALAEQKELENHGYQVVMTHSGKKAIDLFHNQIDIDLILMDINLGSGIDGTETARKILKQREVPIVFLSSHNEKEIVDKTEKITSYGYVVKNFGFTVLDASIKMAFKLFEANQRTTEQKQHLREERDRAQRYLDLAGVIFVALDGVGIVHGTGHGLYFYQGQVKRLYLCQPGDEELAGVIGKRHPGENPGSGF